MTTTPGRNGTGPHRLDADDRLERAADRLTWVKMFVGAAVALVCAGGAAVTMAGAYATKHDLAVAVEAHAAHPHEADAAELERHDRALVEIRTDLVWIKAQLGTIARTVGAPAILPVAPVVTPIP